MNNYVYIYIIIVYIYIASRDIKHYDIAFMKDLKVHFAKFTRYEKYSKYPK